MNVEEAERLALLFSDKIKTLKSRRPDFPWYPYNSFANFEYFKKFSGLGGRIFDFIGPGQRIADIGAADGDTSFFFETLGAEVTIIDNPATNANDCRAILELRAELASKVKVQFVDLEWASWIQGSYDLTIFLGILYHLRNPGLVLNTLAHTSPRLLLSTMVFFRLETGEDVRDQQLAYFLRSREVNNDPTNYWILTPAALRTMLLRSGWLVRDEFFVGDEGAASPIRGDCRMFCFCERVENWIDLRVHHDF